MQPVSQAYKQIMKDRWRGIHSYMRVTIGMVNQEAQASAYIAKPADYTYYSNLKKPMDNYQVQELYATCDQDYTAVDGSMYFLPRSGEDVVLNAGIVSDELLGGIEINFPVMYDIKGLTIEFGKAYPLDFTIESDNNTVEVTGNASGHFVTEEIFMGATFLRFVPARMVNGQSRFRIHTITMGIGIYFDSRKIISATKKEHISPIMEELPTIDLSVTVANRDRAFDIENSESSVNFLEPGQSVTVEYGLELMDGTVEWVPGAALQLKEWSADDEEMDFTSTDRFDSMDGTYYRGQYYSAGISLYDIADDVFQDAGIDNREYWIDPYLRDVKIYNPMPPIPHKEALQIIANAGRCILYQDRIGKIFIKSSFIPDMTAASSNETYYSHTYRVLDKTIKMEYAAASRDYTGTSQGQYFLPRNQQGIDYVNTGYVSGNVAGADGSFAANPTVEIDLEAAYKCFGLTLEFGRNPPKTVVFHAWYNGKLIEDYEVSGLTQTTVISHEFAEFDYLVLEFTKGSSYNRVILDNIYFGDSTDYCLEYGSELTKTPRGTQLSRVRQLQITRTIYNQPVQEIKELAKETIVITPLYNRYVFYLSSPSYDLSIAVTDAQEGQEAIISEQSAYYVVVDFMGVDGAIEVAVTGKEYAVTQASLSVPLNPTGSVEVWENPLVSTRKHAEDMARWIGDYLVADRDYDLQYRGEPRIDANDIAFLENRYIPNMLVRVYDHTLKFNGAISGTIKARRDMSGVVTAKDRLAAGRLV